MDKVNEGNRLIAEFMGYKFLEGEIIDGSTIYMLSELKYHSSWDWLMPVVEKIEQLGYRVLIERGGGITNYCKIKRGKENIADTFSHKYKIEAVWLAVVEFINWYNKNQNNG